MTHVMFGRAEPMPTMPSSQGREGCNLCSARLNSEIALHGQRARQVRVVTGPDLTRMSFVVVICA